MLGERPVKECTVNLGGKPHTLKLVDDFVGRDMMKGHWWEGQKLHDSLKFLKPDWVVIDAGANLGNHAMFWAPHVAKVIAIEACAFTYGLLKFNVEENGYENIELHQACLWDETGSSVTGVADPTNLGHTYYEPNPEGKYAATSTSRLDDFNIEHVDFVKIDVEGAELRVLKGMTKMLKKDRPRLWIDLHHWMHDDEPKIRALLKDFGYKENVDYVFHR